MGIEVNLGVSILGLVVVTVVSISVLNILVLKGNVSSLVTVDMLDNFMGAVGRPGALVVNVSARSLVAVVSITVVSVTVTLVVSAQVVGSGHVRHEGVMSAVIVSGVVIIVFVVLNALVMNGDLAVGVVVSIIVMNGLSVVCMTDGVDELSDFVHNGLCVLVMSELLLMNGSVVLTLVMAVHAFLVVVLALVISGSLMVRGLVVVAHVVTVVFTLTPVVLSGGDGNDGSECERFHFRKEFCKLDKFFIIIKYKSLVYLSLIYKSHARGFMVWWFCGLVVLWFGGFVVWWFCGLVVWWFCGLVVWWFIKYICTFYQDNS